MQKTQSWRELLSEVVKTPRERQRIAEALHVSPVTLNRWIQGESNPRPESLRRLLSLLPAFRPALLASLMQEDPDFAASVQEQERHNDLFIPWEFYKRVLHTLVSLPAALRFPSLCDLILQQALEQLDPYKQGMAVIVACCMPPVAGKVRSLRERTGRGSDPWQHDLEQQGMLLGFESLAGHVIGVLHAEMNSSLHDPASREPGYGAEFEESAVAIPLMQLGKVAGSLLVSSTQPHYFTPAHVTLIESYAELLTLAFDPQDFYAIDTIELAMLPPREEQLPFLSTYARRVAQVLLQAIKRGDAMTYAQAQLLVWQQFEQSLLSSTAQWPEHQSRRGK